MAKKTPPASRRRATSGRRRPQAAAKRSRSARTSAKKRTSVKKKAAKTTGRKKQPAASRAPARKNAPARKKKSPKGKSPATKAPGRAAPKARRPASGGGAASSRKTAARPPARRPPGSRRRSVDERGEWTPPSTLNFESRSSSARSGREESRQRTREHTETGPRLTGGDVDANWETAYSSGDEAPGGDNPTPDQDIVEDVGRSLGLQYQDNEELGGTDKLDERDRHRWEWDPASSEDYRERMKKRRDEEFE